MYYPSIVNNKRPECFFVKSFFDFSGIFFWAGNALKVNQGWGWSTFAQAQPNSFFWDEAFPFGKTTGLTHNRTVGEQQNEAFHTITWARPRHRDQKNCWQGDKRSYFVLTNTALKALGKHAEVITQMEVNYEKTDFTVWICAFKLRVDFCPWYSSWTAKSRNSPKLVGFRIHSDGRCSKPLLSGQKLRHRYSEDPKCQAGVRVHESSLD